MIQHGTVTGRISSPRFSGAKPVPLRGTVTLQLLDPIFTDDPDDWVPEALIVVPLVDGEFEQDVAAAPDGSRYRVGFAGMRANGVPVELEPYLIGVRPGEVTFITEENPDQGLPTTPATPTVAAAIAAAVEQHRTSATPHPVYDDAPDMSILFTTHLI